MEALYKFGKPDNRFCRVAFCPHCFKNHVPKSAIYNPHSEMLEVETYIWLWCGSSKRWKVLSVIEGVNSSNYGFVPHLFEFISQVGDSVQFRKLCMVYLCGVGTVSRMTTLPDGTRQTLYYPSAIRRPDLGYMSEKSWRALMSFTDTGYKIIS